MYRLKAQYEEAQTSIENLNRENRLLSGEIKDLVEQLSNGGKGVHETQKALKRVESEKHDLQKALDEAEAALRQHEGKLLNAQLESSNLKAEIERKVLEKEEEHNQSK